MTTSGHSWPPWPPPSAPRWAATRPPSSSLTTLDQDQGPDSAPRPPHQHRAGASPKSSRRSTPTSNPGAAPPGTPAPISTGRPGGVGHPVALAPSGVLRPAGSNPAGQSRSQQVHRQRVPYLSGDAGGTESLPGQQDVPCAVWQELLSQAQGTHARRPAGDPYRPGERLAEPAGHPAVLDGDREAVLPGGAHQGRVDRQQPARVGHGDP